MIGRLRSKSAREWAQALERDGFAIRKGKGSHHVYQHPDGRRVLVVYHNLGDTFGPKTIKQLLSGTGWREEDLKRLKLLV
ncbi:MAG: type II toxin-antitoxin system HicA family toxin [Terriglobia bacterium]